MRKVLLVFALFLAIGCSAQAFDVEQLVLDVEKLGDLKQILQDLRNGYQVLQSGYSAIRDIARGSFNLHKAYLDGLLAVSPTVRGYARVVEIADLQVRIVGRYQSAWGRLQQGSDLHPSELAMLGGLLSGMLRDCSSDLEDMLMIVTDGVLRASDAERMQEIDVVYYRMRQRLALVNKLCNESLLLSKQRVAEAGDVSILRDWFGVTP
jgi:hypothetical protein